MLSINWMIRHSSIITIAYGLFTLVMIGAAVAHQIQIGAL